MRISDFLMKEELAFQPTLEIHAGVRENFKDVDGGHKCKLCGEVVKHPRAAAAHLAVHHRKALEAESHFDEVAAGKKCKSCGKTIKADDMEAHMKACSG
jgi:hypothetical protein